MSLYTLAPGTIINADDIVDLYADEDEGTLTVQMAFGNAHTVHESDPRRLWSAFYRLAAAVPRQPAEARP